MEVPFEFHRAKATWVAISKYFEIQFWLCDSKGTLKLLSRLDSRPFCIVMVFLIRTELFFRILGAHLYLQIFKLS